MRKIALFGFVFSTLLLASVGQTQKAQSPKCLDAQDQGSAEYARRLRALNAVRLINTALMIHKHQFGRFAGWDELTTSAALKQAGEMGASFAEAYNVMSLAPNTDLLPGFTLHLVTDGTTYSLLLRDKTDPCGFSQFSNEVGIIYNGYPIDRTLLAR